MGKIFIKLGHIFFWLFIWMIIFTSSFVKKTWGDIDLAQFLFFVQTDLNGVDRKLVLKGLFECIFIPVIIVVLFYWVFYLMAKFNKIMAGIFLLVIDCFLVLSVFLCVENCFSSYVSFEKINFYEKNYVNINQLEQDLPRNVIVLFAESLENKDIQALSEEVKLDDNDAIKFDNLTEGYAQRWTQGALFSAFTGVHIHYLSEYLRYALYDKVKWGSFNPEMDIVASHRVGQNFDFYIPNIRVLSDITKEHGYQNLFVKGGTGSFSGTNNFLYAHGFEASDFIYYSKFKGWPNYGKYPDWWGIDDASLIQMFENKIDELDKTKPFFAVGFTLDLHFGTNPFYKDEKSLLISTIVNINNFIQWFRKQDFYNNTTLVIIGDHKRMGGNVKPGGYIYNAFFNLPEGLKENLNIHRTFNQIDMFPTLLEIMGYKLPLHKAGMGTSLFSSSKTLAEDYSYDEQVKIFNKLDDFYHKLWSTENIFDNETENAEK